MWDCIPQLDELTVQFIKSKGGLKGIAFSHPHYYSNMNEWAEAWIVLYTFMITETKCTEDNDEQKDMERKAFS